MARLAHPDRRMASSIMQLRASRWPWYPRLACSATTAAQRTAPCLGTFVAAVRLLALSSSWDAARAFLACARQADSQATSRFTARGLVSTVPSPGLHVAMHRSLGHVWAGAAITVAAVGARKRRCTATGMSAALSQAHVVEDLETFCSSAPERKQAAVYAVFGEDGEARYVGIARDVHGAIASHLATQPDSECTRARLEPFDRPSRDAMTTLQADWIAELGSTPAGNEDSPDQIWANPPVTPAQAEWKLKMRQAIADSTLKQDNPDAYDAVIKKAMKDAEFDGSSLDILDASIESDDEKTRSEMMMRAAGDWQSEVEMQTLETISQVPAIEMYSAPGCPHCERMRIALRDLAVKFTEYNIEDEGSLEQCDEEIFRRARHARFNTVPQLYVLREPPLHGRELERLVGGANELEKEIELGVFQAELRS